MKTEEAQDRSVPASRRDWPRMDRTAISVYNMFDPPDDTAYWLSRPYTERWEALEFLRQTWYGYDPLTDRLQRVLEFARLE